ncbi:MAG: hypothetical protein P1V97_14410 [Planctomycetota bacterium]|nr:hypothetical protein [Planctomycetota bacterium]
MISKRDVQLGKIALQEDMVSKEQINKCLKIKKKLKTKASLGAILLKKGYIDRDQLEIIVGIHNNKSDGKGGDEQKKSKRKSIRKDKEKDSENAEGKDSSKDSERAERRKKRATAKRKREKLEAEQDSDKSKDKSDTEAKAKVDEAEPDSSKDDKDVAEKDDKEARRSKRSKSLEAKRKRRSKRLEAEKGDKDSATKDDAEDIEKSKDDEDADEKSKKRRSGRKKRRSKREDKSNDPDMGPAINKDAEVEAKKAKDEEKDAGDPEKSDDSEEEFLDPSILVSAASEVPDEQADLMANLLASTLEGPEDEHHSFESGASLISDSLLESADMTVSQEEEIVDDTGKIQKKIIACSDCGKKYRVKPKQAGKRFDCRRCNTKVRVPKDYFDAPDEDIQEVPRKKKRRDKKDRKKGRTGRHSRRSKRSKTKASKSSASIPVEEFDLGAMESDEEFEAQSKAKKESKRKSERVEKAKSPKKTETEASYASLAAEALKAPKASVAPQKVSVVQLVIFSVLLIVSIGGVFGYLQYEESVRVAAIDKERKAEWEKISATLLELNKEADELLEKQAVSANDADAFRSMERAVQSRDAVRDTLLFPENRSKAQALSENTYKFTEKRQLLLSKAAEIFVGMNNLAMQQEAVSIYKKTLEIKKTPDVLADYGQALARLYDWSSALASVQEALDLDKSNKKALLAKGHILESADAPNEAADIYELLARAEPFAAVLCARAWLNAGDKASAVKKLGEAANAESVQNDPVKLATVQIFQAEIHSRKDEYDTAETSLKKAVATAPKFPWPHIKLGYLYLKKGDFEKSISEFEAAQKTGGGPEAYLGLAIAHESNFDINKAKEFYRKAAGAKSTATSIGPVIGAVALMTEPLNPQNVRSRAKRRLGDLYRALGDFDRAKREYQESRKADEWNGIALTRLARIFKKMKFDRKAKSFLRTAESMSMGYKQGNPITFEGKVRRRSLATAELFVTLGLFEQMAQKFSRASDAYEIAVKISESLNLKSTEVYTLQARLLLDRNQKKEGIRKFRTLERLEVKNKIYLQGYTAFKNFKKTGAVAELDKMEAAASAVLSQNENHSAALLLRAQSYAGRSAILRKKIGKPDPAKHAEEIKEIDRLVKKAQQFFGESILVNPYSVRARMARGAFLTDPVGITNYQVALEDFKEVTKLESGNIDALYGYAFSAYSLNNFSDAHTAISKAIRKNFNFKKGYALRAKIYDRLNRPKDAEKDRRRAAK